MQSIKRLRLILLVVVLYTITVFSWWTYSLLKFNDENYEQSIENLTLKSEIYYNNIISSILRRDFSKGGKPVGSSNHSLLLNSQLLEAYLKNDSNHIVDFDYTINHQFKSGANYKTIVKILPSKNKLETIKERHHAKRRAYISEVIFYLALLIAGLLWLYKKLEIIINNNQQQNNFLLAITHELKTPLATTLLSLDTAKRKIKKQDYNIGKYLDTGVEGINRFQTLLDDILITTRLEGKSYNYNFEEVNIKDIIELAINQFMAYHPTITINTALSKECWAKIDVKTFSIAISNLLSNAVKYSHNPVKIFVKCRTLEKNIEIVIADEGMGIPNSEKNRIFKRFYRIGNEETRETQGTGLGLNIVKRIIEDHMGKVHVEDNLPNGSKFIIKIKKDG